MGSSESTDSKPKHHHHRKHKSKTTKDLMALPPYTRPSGLYKNNNGWSIEALSKLVLRKNIAPFAKGTPSDESEGADFGAEECPTCCLFYHDGLNLCATCQHGVCSDCWVQMQTPCMGSRSGRLPGRCPFCGATPYDTVYRGRRSRAEIEAERMEAQRVEDREKEQYVKAIAEERDRIARLQKVDSFIPREATALPAESDSSEGEVEIDLEDEDTGEAVGKLHIREASESVREDVASGGAAGRVVLRRKRERRREENYDPDEDLAMAIALSLQVEHDRRAQARQNQKRVGGSA